MPAPATNSRKRKAPSRKAVPPPISLAGVAREVSNIDDEIAAAEQRKATLQVEAVVNIAIGMVITKLGLTEFTYNKDEIAEFARTHRVTHYFVDGDESTLVVKVTS